jgi:Domain of unknown function (DUF4279)
MSSSGNEMDFLEKKVPRMKVSVRISGDFDVLEFSRSIPITPTTTWQEGDTMPHSSLRKYGNSHWEYSTDYRNSWYLEDVILELLGHFVPIRDELSRAIEKVNATAFLNAEIWLYDPGSPSIVFDKNLLSLIRSLSLEINISLYCSRE